MPMQFAAELLRHLTMGEQAICLFCRNRSGIPFFCGRMTASGHYWVMTEMPSQPDDATLVLRSRGGDREAFGCLYDRYAGLVRAMAYDEHLRLADACDITQEAFLRAWQKLSALQEPASFGAWVVGIGRQVGREQYRAAGRRGQVSLGANVPEPATTTCHEAEQLSSERSCLLLQKIAELPEKERLAIHAFYLQGQGVQPVIQSLQLSRAGVYALLKRACRSLASKLKCLAPEQADHK